MHSGEHSTFTRAIPVFINGHNEHTLSFGSKTICTGRHSIPSRRIVVGPALAAMDPRSTEEIIIDTPFFRIYGGRRIDRLVGTATVPPGFDAATGVTSRDVTIDADAGLYVLLYLPADDKKKLPLLVYFQGGAFVTQSASAPAYQPFLGTLAARAVLVFFHVSVNYRLAPEHPLPAGYADSLRALEWAVAGGDPWLSRHGDLARVFLAGESAGGNIAHNVLMMAAAGADETAAAAIEGAALLHAGFSGREPVAGEPPEWVETMGKLWVVLCPAVADGADDPRMNPLALPSASGLR